MAFNAEKERSMEGQLFAKRFEKVLDEKGVSQRELANYLGVSNSTVSQWISRGIVPSGGHLIKICNKLNVSADYMLGIEVNEDDVQCPFCASHEKGDTIYDMTSWDNGFGFEYNRGIRYCPVCGKELANPYKGVKEDG